MQMNCGWDVARTFKEGGEGGALIIMIQEESELEARPKVVLT